MPVQKLEEVKIQLTLTLFHPRFQFPEAARCPPAFAAALPPSFSQLERACSRLVSDFGFVGFLAAFIEPLPLKGQQIYRDASYCDEHRLLRDSPVGAGHNECYLLLDCHHTDALFVYR